jgi:anti-sigma28 factor (negative regulator of flagellin synthesis)
MRISNEELRRIAEHSGHGTVIEEGRMVTSGVHLPGESVVSALESPDMKMISDALARIPDTREQIVASLKERIESGSYHVTGEQIAEMMVRRALADRMR